MIKLATIALLAMALTGPAMAQQAELAQPTQPGAAHSLERADIDAWLDGIVPYALQAGDMAGAVVTVVADGEVLTTKGYGDADAATGKPVDPEHTLFRAGSVSKLMTWTAVMQLVESGALELDTDINTYLDFSIPPFDGQPITLRHVLTHTAGFEEQLKHVIALDPRDAVPFEELVRDFIPARIFAPGTTPAYSNYATALAGYIVQRVSGQPFGEYVDEKIFTPLGMEGATFSQDLTKAQLANLSNGYATATGAATPFELAAASPAGALTVTAPDMARFMLAHLNKGRLGDAQILQPATANLMHERASATIPALNGMALGFYESSVNGHRVIGHGGDTQTFHSDVNLFIDEGVGMFVSINSTGEDDAAYDLRALLFSEFADRYFPAQGTPVLTDIGQGNASQLVGQWTASRRAATSFVSLAELLEPTIITVAEDGTLQGTNLPILGAPVHRWIEVEPFVWQSSNSHERLAATVDETGAARFSLNSMAPIMVYDPVPWQRAANWLVPALLASLGVLALTAAQ
ncbi:MAG TPA: serine hydrolase domain-containing protein [Devosia sp.]|jgi:CubicO group peptidase (beta-lactamase class C family)|nr:serine hydrolase domain-containing protein [Devosia sp.]